MFCLSSRPTWLVFPLLFVGNTSSPVAKVGVRLRGGGEGGLGWLSTSGGPLLPVLCDALGIPPSLHLLPAAAGMQTEMWKKSEPGALSAQA